MKITLQVVPPSQKDLPGRTRLADNAASIRPIATATGRYATMVEHHKIVDFDSKRQRSGHEPPFTLPQLLISARRTTAHHLSQQLPKFFAQLDDHLFDLADKAESNQQQNLYFDLMREVRLKKTAMGKAYLQELERQFLRSLSIAGITPGTPGGNEQISLMDDEQLEESLAITTMISGVENRCREALFALTARIDFLLDDIEITKHNNPLRPEVLCRSFTAAIDEIQTELKTRLIIYKLFDKHIVHHLDVMYDTINADLVAAGVLPRIKSNIVKSEDSLPTPQSGAAAPQGSGQTPQSQVGGANGGGVFESLQHMLSLQRSANDTGAAGGTPGGGQGPAAGSGTGGFYAPQDILGALSALQMNPELPHYQDRSQASAVHIKGVLAQEMSRLFGNADKQLEQTDTDTIDIISMLFDLILDDPNLSDGFKAVIARLQIPILKVAILDKEFFAKKAHPARQLLNELAYAGADGGQNVKTRDMVKYVVERILLEFTDDVSLFSLLLDEFSQFMEQERRNNRQLEQDLTQAKERIAKEIKQRLDNNPLPAFIHSLLVEPWKEVLTKIHLRDGGDGVAWNTALRVADDLIWSVQPKLVVSERQRLIKLIPKILNGLRDGLTLINYDRARTEQIFSQLEELHLSSLRGGLAPRNPAPASDISRLEAELDEPLADIQEDEDELIEEIILSSTREMDWEGWQELQSEHADNVKNMALGSWVEFKQADKPRPVRGKLAWKCDFTGDYTFVDRKYKVVADLSYRELLQEFDQGRAALIEDIPLFDRALDALLGSFKRKADSTEALSTPH